MEIFLKYGWKYKVFESTTYSGEQNDDLLW